MTYKSVHVIPSISNESSGPSYSVVNLCRSLIEAGVEVTLVDLDDSDQKSKPDFVRSFKQTGYPMRLGRSPAMRAWLTEKAINGQINIMHNHSLWMMPNVYSCNAVKGINVPLVVSPRGTLSDWAMNNGSKIKKIFWPLVQYPALRAVACFHATAESEYLDIRRLGFRQPVAVIPNGIDIPATPQLSFGSARTLLFLGRIHPVKGLDMLLPAWAALQYRFPDWRLRIVGPDNSGYLEQIKILAGQLGLERIEFTGPLTGVDKASAYAEADLFVLPTYSENFGMAVAESLAVGTPAIVTKGAPWSGLNAKGAGWWINIDKGSLIACLQEAMTKSVKELREMGDCGRTWMQESYSWENIALEMRHVYEWLLREIDKPKCVITD